MEYALKTYELTKRYGEKNAVDNVNMTIRKGDVYGFVGKNGAGKTTLIRLILGLAKPTSGRYEFFNGIEQNKARRRIGNLVESPALYPNISGKQNLSVYCKMLGADENCIPTLLNYVGLGSTGTKKARDFSLGMKQRLGIAIALIGDPDFLILDEPINGLDPEGIVEVRDLILRLNHEQGKTILISSHILGELNKIATCYGIINSGKLVEEITNEELLKKCTTSTLIKTNNPEKARDLVLKFLSNENQEVPNIFIRTDGTLVISNEITNSGELAQEIFSNGIMVESLSTEGGDLENYFIERMGAGKN